MLKDTKKFEDNCFNCVYLSRESENLRSFTTCTCELPKMHTVVGTQVRVAITSSAITLTV